MCRRGPATDSATVELAETAAVIGYIRGRLFLVVLTLLAAFRPRGRPKAAVKKVAVKLRLDPDVLEGYRARGERWQTLMNSVLREGLSRQRGVEKKKRA